MAYEPSQMQFQNVNPAKLKHYTVSDAVFHLVLEPINVPVVHNALIRNLLLHVLSLFGHLCGLCAIGFMIST